MVFHVNDKQVDAKSFPSTLLRASAERERPENAEAFHGRIPAKQESRAKGLRVEVELDVRRSAMENASACFELAKKAAAKRNGAREAIEKTQKEIAQAKEGALVEGAKAKGIKMKRKREWFEAFRWFYTSGGRLVLAGRDAKQNDLLYARHLEDGDLFFHADIQGAPAVVLKDGAKAGDGEKLQAAKFAASFSSAWKIGAAEVDSYCVKKSQLGKHAQGGFVGKGGFAIEGAREWFRKMKIETYIGLQRGLVACAPEQGLLEKAIRVLPGGDEKGRAAKFLAKKLSCDESDVLSALPSGKIKIMLLGEK
jgi:predicted ribosome quality control (RQC) complex YloA/Tae2 family protein